jgi:mono/diheme cytochrome c family protein
MPVMKMRALGSAEVQAKSDDELKKDITAGNGKMKAVAVSDAQAADLVAYIRTLKK